MRRVEAEITKEYARLRGKTAGVEGEGNATELVLTFDASWDGYVKRLMWLNVHGRECVTQLLFADNATDAEVRSWTVLIPGEPLKLPGWCECWVEGFTSEIPVDGTADGGEEFEPYTSAAAKSVRIRLEVLPNSGRYKPAEPTPTQAEQLMEQYGKLREEVTEQLDEFGEELHTRLEEQDEKIGDLSEEINEFKDEVNERLDSYSPSLQVVNAAGFPSLIVSENSISDGANIELIAVGGIWLEVDMALELTYDGGDGGNVGIYDRTWYGSTAPPEGAGYTNWERYEQ